MRKMIHFPESGNHFDEFNSRAPGRNRQLFGKIGRFLGGAAKGLVKGIGKAAKGVPILGQILTIGESAVIGAFGRTGAAVQTQLANERVAQSGFQLQQNVGLGASLGLGSIIQNPLVLLLVGGGALFFILRNRK